MKAVTIEEKLFKLGYMMEIAMISDNSKHELYINFLKKYSLPNSGPTIELLKSLNNNQRVELINIFKNDIS